MPTQKKLSKFLATTHKQLQCQKRAGLITDYMEDGLRRGRPTSPCPPPVVAAAAAASIASTKRKRGTNTNCSKYAPPGRKKKNNRSSTYTMWLIQANAEYLTAAAQRVIDGVETVKQAIDRSETELGAPSLSDRQIRRKIKEVKEGSDKTKSKVDGRCEKSLLLVDEVSFLQETIVERDTANNGMTRKEIITCIQFLCGCQFKAAENHYDYLIRTNKLPNLKGGGKTVIAQNTTTARSQIRVESQLRWHYMIDAVWTAVKKFNCLPPGDQRRPFQDVMEYFWLNLDETCIRCDDNGIRVVGARGRITSKRGADSKVSITILRVGSAAGIDGPIIFLVEGKSIDIKPLKDLPKNFGCPIGSCVLPTPTAYMTDDAWKEVVPHLIEGIRAMEGIKDYPEFKCMLTFDGYGSHLLPIGLIKLAEALIEVAKEEACTSALNQAYDQYIAKKDKLNIRSMISFAIGNKNYSKLSQWEVVVASITGVFSKINPDKNKQAWITSFQKVNCHPRTRILFPQWCRKIDSELETGERFFKDRTSLFDAMPAIWKHMSTEMRRKVYDIIDSFYSESSSRQDPWRFDNIKKLLRCVRLDDVKTVRACYFAAKNDPSVFTTPLTTVASSTKPNLPLLGDDSRFSWKPKSILERYKKDRKNKSLQKEFFDHICNTVARQHAGKKKMMEYKESSCLLPSSYTLAEVRVEQHDLLNPTPRTCFLGYVMDDAVGEKAVRKIAKRKLDMMTGNIAQWTQHVTSTENLELLKEATTLSERLAILSAEALEEKEERRKEKEMEARAKAQKEKEKALEEQNKKEKATKQNEIDMAKGLEYVLKLNNDRRKEILHYEFGVPKKDLSKMLMDQLKALIRSHWKDSSRSCTFASGDDALAATQPPTSAVATSAVVTSALTTSLTIDERNKTASTNDLLTSTIIGL